MTVWSFIGCFHFETYCNSKFAQYEYNLANGHHTGTLDNVMKILCIRQIGHVPSDRAVYGVGLRSLACWECGFESRLGHGCLSVVRVVCWQVDVSATGWSLIKRSPTEFGASECHFEASVMRKRWPTRGCLRQGKKKKGAHFNNIEKSYVYKKTKKDSQTGDKHTFVPYAIFDVVTQNTAINWPAPQLCDASKYFMIRVNESYLQLLTNKWMLSSNTHARNTSCFTSFL